MLRKVACGMTHALVCGGDVHAGGVVVRAEVCTGEPSPRDGRNARQQRPALRVDDDLRHLDHHLELQRAVSKPELLLETPQLGHDELDLLENDDLRHGDDKIVRHPAGELHEFRYDDLERTSRTRAELLIQRLDANADERGKRPSHHAIGQARRHRPRMTVLLCIGTIPVAVLEIDAEILDGFALELLHETCVDG